MQYQCCFLDLISLFHLLLRVWGSWVPLGNLECRNGALHPMASTLAAEGGWDLVDNYSWTELHPARSVWTKWGTSSCFFGGGKVGNKACVVSLTMCIFLKLLVDTSSLYVRDMSDDVCTEYYVRALLSRILNDTSARFILKQADSIELLPYFFLMDSELNVQRVLFGSL